tara:strand:+ start:3778 stop:4665 length:888 start_codon:yes stop_codon:yes gene_type:complete
MVDDCCKLNVYESYIVTSNEDRRFQFHLNDYLCVGVADGHGGFGAAETCKNHICELLQNHIEAGKTITKSIVDTFSDLHDLCLKLTCKSGCTLTVVVIDKQTMEYVCVNVGDSYALHISHATHMWITTSHRLQDNVGEREKLKDHISYIKCLSNQSIGPPRLYPGGLSCSRAIGDADCPFISCLPSVYHDKLAKDDIICVATDGVWDVISCSKVLKILRNTCNPDDICRNIQKQVVKDDVSLIIVSTQKMKQSIINKLFYRSSGSSSSNSSMSDEEFAAPIVVKVPISSSNVFYV